MKKITEDERMTEAERTLEMAQEQQTSYAGGSFHMEDLDVKNTISAGRVMAKKYFESTNADFAEWHRVHDGEPIGCVPLAQRADHRPTGGLRVANGNPLTHPSPHIRTLRRWCARQSESGGNHKPWIPFVA